MANSNQTNQDIQIENIDLEESKNTFDFQINFEELLKHSQDLALEYGALLQRLETIIATLDTSTRLLANDIITLYTNKIETHTDNIFKISSNFMETKQSPAIKELLSKIANKKI